MVQYKTTVLWDTTLVSLMFVEDTATTREAKIAGLVQSAIKITTGAPSAVTTAGRCIAGALVQNAVDASEYINKGTVAVPVWALVTHA